MIAYLYFVIAFYVQYGIIYYSVFTVMLYMYHSHFGFLLEAFQIVAVEKSISYFTLHRVINRLIHSSSSHFIIVPNITIYSNFCTELLSMKIYSLKKMKYTPFQVLYKRIFSKKIYTDLRIETQSSLSSSAH